MSEGPVSEGPVSEGPVSEGPVSEEPVSEEPVSEEPVSERPVLRVLRGSADDTEIAALTVALTLVTGARAEPTAGPVSRWNDPTARMRREVHPGPDAWRTSYWPR